MKFNRGDVIHILGERYVVIECYLEEALVQKMFSMEANTKNILEAKLEKNLKYYTNRYIKALVDSPHRGTVKKGEIGRINDIGKIEFNSYKDVGYYAPDALEKPELYQLMPVDYKPEEIIIHRTGFPIEPEKQKELIEEVQPININFKKHKNKPFKF